MRIGVQRSEAATRKTGLVTIDINLFVKFCCVHIYKV